MGSIYTRERSWQEMAGYLTRLPDPDSVLQAKGYDVSIYRQLTFDAHVDSCMTSREAGVLSCEWDWQVDSSRREDKRALDFVKDVFANIDTETLTREILEAVYYGLSVLEKVTTTDGNRIYYSAIEGRPPEWFVFDNQNQLRFLSKGKGIDGELVEMDRIELVRHRATYRNPYGERKLARVFWPVSFKKGGVKFWMNFLEKYGGALMYIMTQEQNQEKIDKMLDMLDRMVEDATGVFQGQPGDQLMTVDVNKAGSSLAFSQMVGWSNAEVSKAILGQTLTTEQGNVGSQALGTVHFQVRGEIVEGDKKMVANTFNRLARSLVNLNYNVEKFPSLKYFEEEDVAADRAQRDALLYNIGWRPTPKYLADKYRMKEGDDFAIKEETTPELPFAEKDVPLSGVHAPAGLPPSVGVEKKNIPRLVRDDVKVIVLTDIEIATVEAEDKAFDAAIEGETKKGKLFEPFVNAIHAALEGASEYDEAMQRIADSLDIAVDAEPADSSTSVSFGNALLAGDILGRIWALRLRSGQARWNDAQNYASQEVVSLADMKGKIPPQTAVDFLKMKVPMPKADFLALGEKYRNFAFTVTGDLKEETIADLLKSLIDAKEGNIPYKEWVSGWMEKGVLPEARLKQVYWENMRSAQMAGKMAQLRKDVDIAPYWQRIATMDKGTRPEHAAMHGMIRRYDDPFWDEHTPKDAFGCRCTVRSLSPEYLKNKGIDPEKLPQGAPDMKEVVANNSYNPDFETLVAPKLNNFDTSGKLLLKTPEGFENNAGKDFGKWLEIKQNKDTSGWKNLIDEKVDLKTELKDVLEKKAGFDVKGKPEDVSAKAKAYLKEIIPDGKITDKFGNTIYIDTDRLIDHVIPVDKPAQYLKNLARLKYLNLFEQALKNPDAVVISLQEAPGIKKKSGMVKLGKGYILKVEEGGYWNVVINSTREYPGYSGWTFSFRAKETPGIMVRQKK